MTTKKCNTCGETKPVSEFYLDTHKDLRKRTKDGYSSKCKACISAYFKARNQTPEAKERNRINVSKWFRTEKGQAYYQKRIKTQEFKDVQNRYRRSEKGRARRKRINEQYPDFYHAQNKVRSHIVMGYLPKASSQQCKNCDAQAHEYHHYLGYAKEHWLDVIPLCRACHRAAHGK